MNNAGMSTLSS